jgi:hypothetical protein
MGFAETAVAFWPACFAAVRVRCWGIRIADAVKKVIDHGLVMLMLAARSPKSASASFSLYAHHVLPRAHVERAGDYLRQHPPRGRKST